MAAWSAVSPLALLLAGAIPFLFESGVRLRVLGAVLSLIIGFAALVVYVTPDAHVWFPRVQLCALALAIAAPLWIDRSRLRGERTGGLLFLHSLTFLYFISLKCDVTHPGLWITIAATAVVATASFIRTPGHLFWRMGLGLWLLVVLIGLFTWEATNALRPQALLEVRPEGKINFLDPQVYFLGAQQILYGGSFAFLALSFISALSSAKRAVLELVLKPGTELTRVSLCPAQDRRFPLPGAIAVVLLHAIPLVILRLVHPHVPDSLVLNLSLAASPLLVTGLLRRTGWGGLREVPLQDETGLDRMRRSTLHKTRTSHHRAS